MPRIIFNLSDEADEALKKVSKESGKPVALLLREATEVYLRSIGVEVDAKVQWGGNRRPQPVTSDKD